jgi:hypothetical protein
MSQRSENLASRFEEANDEFARAIEQSSEAQWQSKCEDLGWSYGVTAHHVAGSTDAIISLAQMIAAGQTLPPITMEQIDQGNAAHAQQFANCTKPETLDLVRRSGASATSSVRALTDDQLDRKGAMPLGEMTVEQALEQILIGHMAGHLQSMKAVAPA